jgi:hypothetical protein
MKKCRNPRRGSKNGAPVELVIPKKKTREQFIDGWMELPVSAVMDHHAALGPEFAIVAIDTAICFLADEALYEQDGYGAPDPRTPPPGWENEPFSFGMPEVDRRLQAYMLGARLANSEEYKGLVLMSLIAYADDETLAEAIDDALTSIRQSSGGAE